MRLIHPIKVTIEQTDKESTLMDDNLREPIGGVARKAEITVKAQVTYRRKDDPDADRESLNVEEHTEGWLTLRTLDLKRAGVTLQRGDKITKIGEGDLAEEVSYFLDRKQPLGHKGRGGHFFRFYFVDRNPIASR